MAEDAAAARLERLVRLKAELRHLTTMRANLSDVPHSPGYVYADRNIPRLVGEIEELEAPPRPPRAKNPHQGALVVAVLGALMIYGAFNGAGAGGFVFGPAFLVGAYVLYLRKA